MCFAYNGYNVDDLFRCNKYFIEQRAKVEEILSRGVLWPPNIIVKLLANVATFRTHMTNLFDLAMDLFQSKTPPIDGDTRRVQKIININEVTCTCSKWQLHYRPCLCLITCYILWNIDYVQFVHNFFSNVSYKNAYTHFQPLLNTPLCPVYIGLDLYGCPIKWWINKD